MHIHVTHTSHCFARAGLSPAERNQLWSTLQSLRGHSGNTDCVEIQIDDVDAPTGFSQISTSALSPTSNPVDTVMVPIKDPIKVATVVKPSLFDDPEEELFVPVQRSCLRRWQESEVEFRLFQVISAVLFGYDFGYGEKYPWTKGIKWGYRFVIFTWTLWVYAVISYVDGYSFKHASTYFIVGNSSANSSASSSANSSVPHPFAKLAEFTTMDGMYLAWHTSLYLLVICIDIFMFYWCDVAMPFMRPKFMILKQNMHWAIFISLFYGYLLCFSLGTSAFEAWFQADAFSKSYDEDLAVFRAFKAQHNNSLTWEETVNGCCRMRNAWAYMTFPVSTGSVETGIALRRFMEPLAMNVCFFHMFWSSAVWTMVLMMLYSEYQTSIKDLNWQDINSGKAFTEYLHAH